MTAAVLDRPACRFAASSVEDRMTLEERLNSVLSAAWVNGSAECPVCHARMTSTRAGAGGSRGGAVAGAGVSAACGGCGSRLS